MVQADSEGEPKTQENSSLALSAQYHDGAVNLPPGRYTLRCLPANAGRRPGHGRILQEI
jgi:hypothetical protein